MRRSRFALVLITCAAAAALAAVAHAERKPTTKERIQIASVIHLPAACAHVRVATTSPKPKWGKVSWRDGGDQCTALASNGVTIVHRSSGRWRFVTAGSSFTCSELHDQVPSAVVNDLRIKCVKA
jgi:hypothetical protein